MGIGYIFARAVIGFDDWIGRRKGNAFVRVFSKAMGTWTESDFKKSAEDILLMGLLTYHQVDSRAPFLLGESMTRFYSITIMRSSRGADDRTCFPTCLPLTASSVALSMPLAVTTAAETIISAEGWSASSYTGLSGLGSAEFSPGLLPMPVEVEVVCADDGPAVAAPRSLSSERRKSMRKFASKAKPELRYQSGDLKPDHHREVDQIHPIGRVGDVANDAVRTPAQVLVLEANREIARRDEPEECIREPIALAR